MKVSAVLIIKNEEENLRLSLPKLSWCDEIIVVDDCSTDNSLEVCKSFGCKIFERKLDGFGTQKRYAVSKAENNWIINIDADELLPDKLIEEIKINLTTEPDVAGFYVKRQHFFMKRRFKYSKESKRYYLRLFNKNKAAFNDRKVHETVETNLPTLKLKESFIHHSFRDIAHYFAKQNLYTSLFAEGEFAKNQRKDIFVKIITSPFVFFKSYFVDLNFMEGVAGLSWSLFYVWFRLVKYLKLEEKYR